MSSRRWGRAGAPISRGPAPPSGAAGPRHGGVLEAGRGTVLPWGTATERDASVLGGQRAVGGMALTPRSFYVWFYVDMCVHAYMCV